jgi:hypothetical protein
MMVMIVAVPMTVPVLVLMVVRVSVRVSHRASSRMAETAGIIAFPSDNKVFST